MDPRARLEAALGAAYQLQRELGGGGMSRVYLAEEVALARSVVIKILAPELTGDLSIERFQREIALAARLQHPHIVPLLTAGDAAGTPWYAMPYVEGETLRARLARGPLPVPEAVRILRDIAGALAWAHERGVIHRDIKPENVLLADGRAVVTDFGVAKALVEANRTTPGPRTTVGIVVGTAAYMAPEQAAGDPQLDHRADLYALGIVAWELLTGHHPFGSRGLQQMMAAHASEAPRPVTEFRAAVPPALATLVMACLAKSPADRPQTARELSQVLDSLTVTSGEAIVPARSPRPAAWRRPWVAVAVVALIVTLSALAVRGSRTQSVEGRVAVLPFDNLTGDSTLARLGEIAAQSITEGISRVDASHVVHYLTVRSALANAAPGDDLIARTWRRTGAGVVVHGRITRSGDSITVNALLTHGPTGEVIRTLGPFTGHAADPLGPIAELGDRLAGSFAWSRVQRASLGRVASPSIGALNEFMEGLDRLARGEEDLGARFFERAIALDSTFVDAYVYLGMVHGSAARYADLDSLSRRLEAMRGAIPARDRLRLDHFRALGRGDHDRARLLLQELVARDSAPGDLYLLGMSALNALRLDLATPALEAVEEIFGELGYPSAQEALIEADHLGEEHARKLVRVERARQRWPQVSTLMGQHLAALAALGEGPRALALADTMLGGLTLDVPRVIQVARAVQEFEAHGDRPTAVELLGRLRQVVARAGQATRDSVQHAFFTAHLSVGEAAAVRSLLPELRRNGGDPRGAVFAALAGLQMGDSSLARTVDAQLEGQPDELSTYLRAALQAHLGDHASALRLLRQSLASQRINGSVVHATVLFRPLRGHPEFEALIRPLGR